LYRYLKQRGAEQPAGEQRTAGVLAGLGREGYLVLHAVPLSPRKDIDHPVIGPTGIHAINTKASSYEVTAKADAVYADGYRQKWVESLIRDAGPAGEYLARAARMELAVRPLVAVWLTIGLSSSSPPGRRGRALHSHYRRCLHFPCSLGGGRLQRGPALRHLDGQPLSGHLPLYPGGLLC